ncbi:MAG: DUF4238 domain-containing protein [Myxococcales bacterium]|nr:DUF4238 domain-containing protein [Myxococcales bacterium]
MSAGPWQHYLPAAYVGGFAIAPAPRLRESRLWVGRRGIKDVYPRKAEGVAAAKHLYTAHTVDGVTDPLFVDTYWSQIEPRVPTAIDELINTTIKPLSADVWMEVLVPFAAHVFTRGIDFADRLPHRLGPLASAAARNDVNYDKFFRLRDAQTMLTIVMRSSWTVLHAPPGVPFICNDVARAGMLHMQSGEAGFVIPLRKDAALVLTKAPNRRPRFEANDTVGDSWIMGKIYHTDLKAEDAVSLNEALARQARDEFYGGDEAQVRTLHRMMGASRPAAIVAEPLSISEEPRVLRHYMLLYAYAMTFLGRRPSMNSRRESVGFAEIEWQRVSRVLPVAFVPIPTPPFLKAHVAAGKAMGIETFYSQMVPLRSGVEPRIVMEVVPYERPSPRRRARGK